MYGKNYFFYKCIRRTIIQFLSLFNGIEIERYEQDGTVKGKYLVPLKFVPKSKAYMWISDKGLDEQMLPMMIVSMTGIDFDVNRMTSRHENIRISTSYSALQAVYANNATPYNISFALQIFALNTVDIDQIYEQILPYFAPFAYFTVNIPEMNLTFEVKVILNSCSPMMTDDTTEEEARVIKWETQFQVQTYLFKPITTVDIIGRLPFDTSPSAAEMINKGSWVSGSNYEEGDFVIDDGKYYVCIEDHTSSIANEPPNAAYWQELISPPAPSAWSIEDGWTGNWSVTAGLSSWETSASSGGVLFRLYTTPSAWSYRDNPIEDVTIDDRPAEILAIQPVGLIEVDGDAKVLIDMEML